MLEIHHMKGEPQSSGCTLHQSELYRGLFVCEHRHLGHARQQLLKKLKAFGRQLRLLCRNASETATRPREAHHIPRSDRIEVHCDEHDRGVGAGRVSANKLASRPPAKYTSHFSVASSLASTGSLSSLLSACRLSILRLGPSTRPNSLRRCTNAMA